MNPDPLAALHPLREPAAVGWWPPAPGWWVLLLLALAVIAVTCYLLWRRYQRGAYRRRALRQLEQLHCQHAQNPDNGRYLEGVNALLKSVALVAYPARDVASRHGESWRLFLNEHLPGDEQFTEEFGDAAYRQTPPAIDEQKLYRSASYWIRHHKVAA